MTQDITFEQKNKLNDEKVFRDPVHDYIHVNDQLIMDLINSREFSTFAPYRVV